MLIKLCNSDRPKSNDAEIAIAVAYARAFDQQLVPEVSQADAVAYMRRVLPHASAHNKSVALLRLLDAIGAEQRHSINSDLLADCRALCDALVQPNDAYTPGDLDKFVSALTIGISPADDEKTKTWALSLITKLAKMAAALPEGGEYSAPISLCSAIDRGKFSADQQQLTVVEILERYRDPTGSVPILASPSLRELVQRDIDFGIIAPHLAPRFKTLTLER